MTICNCNLRPALRVLHEVFGSEEDADEVGEPVGPLVHEAGVGEHVDLHLVPLTELHHDTLPHHAVLVVGVMILVVETGNLTYIHVNNLN